LWGDYDESASAQSFAEAVKCWRGDETAETSTGNPNSAFLVKFEKRLPAPLLTVTRERQTDFVC